jgi:predicted ATP-grasp superfamily ATP-dependent carboligase
VPASIPLAIVGASARAAAASAARAGFQPVTADLFADLDLRRIASATRIAPYPEGLLDWLRAIEPPAWMYTGALENYPDLVDQMAWIAPLWGNAADVLSQVRSPLILGDTLRNAGFLFPETRWSPDGLPRDGSWLAKTYRGASGSGVRELVVDGTGTIPPAYYQLRVTGVPCSGVFLGNGYFGECLGLTRQLIGEDWLGARDFQYAGSLGPITIAGAAVAAVRRIGHELAKCFGLIGLFGIDFIIDGERVWTIEVNPRYTASVEIVERAAGNIFTAHAIVCMQVGTSAVTTLPNERALSRSTIQTQSIHGKAILFAKRPVNISAEFAEWALGESETMPWPNVADVSAAGTSIAAGRPVITVFANGSSIEEVEQRLRSRVAEIEARLYAD